MIQASQEAWDGRLEVEAMIGLGCVTRNAGVCKERAPGEERCDWRVLEMQKLQPWPWDDE